MKVSRVAGRGEHLDGLHYHWSMRLPTGDFVSVADYWPTSGRLIVGGRDFWPENAVAAVGVIVEQLNITRT